MRSTRAAWWGKWGRLRRNQPGRAATAAQQARRWRPWLESLEPRALLSAEGLDFEWALREPTGAEGEYSYANSNSGGSFGPYNSPPVANDDWYEGAHDRPLSVPNPGILANDGDPNNDPISWILDAQPINGQLQLNAAGGFTYTPNAGFVGTDTFWYHLTDGKSISNQARVTIGVTNHPPAGSDDFYVAVYNSRLVVDTPGVLINDSDSDTDPLRAYLVDNPSHGTLVFNTDGSFEYSPHSGYEGGDQFTYRPHDGLSFGSSVTVTIRVVRPRMDIDTDSDNSGAITYDDDPLEDESFETQAPGNIVRWNNDDDNANEHPDRRDGPGFGVFDDELELALLAMDNSGGANLKDFVIELRPSANLRLWADRMKEPLATRYVIGTHALPSMIWIEGIEKGAGSVDLVLLNPDGGLVHADRVAVTVAHIDLIGYRPQSEGPGYGAPFGRHPVPAEQENSPGIGIRRNGDDDNADGWIDLSPADTGIAGENDLVEAEIDFAGGTHVAYVLLRSSKDINVWQQLHKSGPLLDGITDVMRTGPLTSGRSVWVEWATMNPLKVSALLSAQVIDARNGNVAFGDGVRFVPFRSVVIALGGEFQAPSDPAPAGAGTFQIAIELYELGYDVHMYDEDEVGWTTGAGRPYDEIVNAIQNRGVGQVVIFGYSHGGGAAYQVAERLAENPGGLITNPYVVPVTGYIDAIVTIGNAAEVRRPPGAVFHVNQYQKNSTWVSGDRSGGDDEIDYSWLGLVHETIDDYSGVHDLLIARILQKVDR